ncbi:MmpS family transport accessory protein [Nocardia noduli]|uniref:MmpS family transport accessory protein n=1 Tax=Nocardia noduli TaxID=2815722 RepID=UPI001C233678|nr:MmpS family transport accessory protein [Nocardia noduli]
MTHPQNPHARRTLSTTATRWTSALSAVALLAVGGCATHHDSAEQGNGAHPTASLDDHPTTGAGPVQVPPLTAPQPAGTGVDVVYEVISDASTLPSVTFVDGNSAMQQQAPTTAPWTKKFVNNSTYVILGLSAQTNGNTVTCRISVDGQIIDEKTATGKYALVICAAPS